MPITSGFNHVATLTPNMDRLIAFYTSAFGAVVMFEMEKRDDHPRMTIIDLGGGAALNVFEAEPEEIVGEQRKQGSRGAIDHFALAVADRATLAAVRGRVIEAGGEVGDIQQLGSELSLFFRDPDGMELEVCCKAE